MEPPLGFEHCNELENVGLDSQVIRPGWTQLNSYGNSSLTLFFSASVVVFTASCTLFSISEMPCYEIRDFALEITLLTFPFGV